MRQRWWRGAYTFRLQRASLVGNESSDAHQVAVVAAQMEQCQGHVLVKGLWLAPHRRGNIHMQLKSICLGLSFDEIIPEVAEEGHAAERYAVALCAEEQAHLSVFMAAPIFRIPSARTCTCR